MRYLSSSLLFAALTCSPLAYASSYTYQMSETFSGFSVTGTITTNSDSGVLKTGNIKDWDLVLNDGVQTLVLDKADSQEIVIGNGLVASATALTFDFGSSRQNQILFQNPGIEDGTNYFCFQDQGGGCDSTPGANESVQVGTDNPEVVSLSGARTIASMSTGVTPEPGSLTLFGTGLLGTLGVLRRRLVS